MAQESVLTARVSVPMAQESVLTGRVSVPTAGAASRPTAGAAAPGPPRAVPGPPHGLGFAAARTASRTGFSDPTTSVAPASLSRLSLYALRA